MDFELFTAIEVWNRGFPKVGTVLHLPKLALTEYSVTSP
jgi:hypothetical protein